MDVFPLCVMWPKDLDTSSMTLLMQECIMDVDTRSLMYQSILLSLIPPILKVNWINGVERLTEQSTDYVHN